MYVWIIDFQRGFGTKGEASHGAVLIVVLISRLWFEGGFCLRKAIQISVVNGFVEKNSPVEYRIYNMKNNGFISINYIDFICWFKI